MGNSGFHVVFAEDTPHLGLQQPEPGWVDVPLRGAGVLEGAKLDKERSLGMCSANSALRHLKIQGSEER